MSDLATILNNLPKNNSKKVGINGFGRIGRMVLRAYLMESPERNPFPEYEIVAINNPLKKGQTIEHFLHLLEYDSVHGRLKKNIEVVPEGFKVNGLDIKFYTEMDPANIPWGDTQVEVVLDCTGVFKDNSGLSKHIHSTVKKVILSSPGTTDLMVVFGANEELYDKTKHHIISNASCTTNCLAPIAKVIDEAFGIEKGLMVTTHSYTMDQNLQDNLHEDLRRARCAALNIIPTKTGAASSVSEVLPHLKGKLDGYALRVPTPDVSIIDTTFIVKKDTTKEEVNKILKEASEGKLKGILGFTTKELVSSDFIGDSRSSIVDSKYTQVMGNMVKIVSWYDNEWGYSCRMLDLIKLV